VRVALYARVSTDRQEREGTIGSQLDALQTRAAKEGWAVEMTCTDEGYSGANLDRPGLDRARDAAAAGLIDAVVALCPDRLARNYVHQMLVLDELSRFGVSVLFCDGGPTDDPQGRLMVQIQAAVAEFERTKIAERNRRGKLWRARQGAVVSGQVPFGYRKVPASDGLPARVVIYEAEAAVVRQVFEWHVDEGLSVRTIAMRLIEAGIPAPKGKAQWQTSTLDRMLRQPAYAGTLYYNRRAALPPSARVPRHSQGHRPICSDRPRSEWIGVAVPPIVELGTWTRSQALHRRNAQFSPRHVGTECYLLRYLVRCGECGQARAAAGRMKPNGPQRYYRCDHVLPMHLRAENLRCSQPSARADELDQLVWAEVVRHMRRPELLVQACTGTADDGGNGSGARRQLAEVRTQHRRLLDAYQAGAIGLADFEARQRPLQERATELERSAALDQDHRATRAELERHISAFSQKVSDRLDEMTFAERQELLRLVLDKVVVTEIRVELFFKIPLAAKEYQSRRLDGGRLRSRCLFDREVGRLQPGGGVGGVPSADLSLDEAGQEVLGRPALGLGREHQLGGEAAHRRQLEAAQADLELGGQGRGRGGHDAWPVSVA
jgi:site-specific DNA recombinase